MKKRIMTLMLGMLLLLTACGQTGSNSASKMMPVAAVQSAAQTIAPVEDTVQEDVDFLPAEEGVEEVKGADDKETPNPAEDTDTPSAKTEETSTTPAETAPPAAPKEPAIPAPVPEDKPAPAPTPAPTQKPAEKQEEEPAPTPEPVPAPEPKPEPADRWAAVEAANAYAAAQYGVITDGSLTLDETGAGETADTTADGQDAVPETVENNDAIADDTAPAEQPAV